LFRRNNRKTSLYLQFTLGRPLSFRYISDTGQGFPNADSQGRVKIEKIKSSKQRIGFGFTHMKFFTKLYKGDIEIYNIPGKGGAVKITLPALTEFEEAQNDQFV